MKSDKPDQIWPDLLYVVRHGESAGNVARDAALEAGDARINIDIRDVDVPLSDLGQRQAIAVGRWFGALPLERRPNIVLTSPYLRSRHTASLIAETAGMKSDSYTLIVDERLREKEFGILHVEPEPWRAEDVLAWTGVILWGQSGNWDKELLGAQIAGVASTINYQTNRTLSNNAIVRVGSDTINVYDGGPTLHFVIDVNGYFK